MGARRAPLRSWLARSSASWAEKLPLMRTAPPMIFSLALSSVMIL